jgi:hypothetical protein
MAVQRLLIFACLTRSIKGQPPLDGQAENSREHSGNGRVSPGSVWYVAMSSEPMNATERAQQPAQLQKPRRCGARTKSGNPCRSPATKKGRYRLHGGARGSGGPPGERNGQYRHGERTKAAIAERQKFSALLKMLRAGLT